MCLFVRCSLRYCLFVRCSVRRSVCVCQVFREMFGLRSFRVNQKEVINAALLKHDTFVLMPTGEAITQSRHCLTDDVKLLFEKGRKSPTEGAGVGNLRQKGLGSGISDRRGWGRESPTEGAGSGISDRRGWGREGLGRESPTEGAGVNL